MLPSGEFFTIHIPGGYFITIAFLKILSDEYGLHS